MNERYKALMPFCMAEGCAVSKWSRLHVHHVLPRHEKGSSNAPGNLITLCISHHRQYERLTHTSPQVTMSILVARKRQLEIERYGVEVAVLAAAKMSLKIFREILDLYHLEFRPLWQWMGMEEKDRRRLWTYLNRIKKAEKALAR